MKVQEQLLLGAHLSVAGGLENSLITAKKIGCTSVQIFTHSNRQWHMNPLTEKEVSSFLRAKEETGIHSVIVHASYLINMASSKEELRAVSIKTAIKELERCEQLHIPYLVLHPGSSVGTTAEEGMKNLATSLDHVLEAVPGRTMILLETMAGQGSCLGRNFEQLAQLRSAIHHKNRIGICADTCHLFSAGYNFNTPDAYEILWQQFDHVIGLQHLRAIHMNDSKTPCGSLVDRHTHIGEGTLGLEAFRLIMNDQRFFGVPKILETPKDDKDPLVFDLKNLATLKGLVSAANKRLLNIE